LPSLSVPNLEWGHRVAVICNTVGSHPLASLDQIANIIYRKAHVNSISKGGHNSKKKSIDPSVSPVD
jgi:hypothetical protein